MTKVADYHRKLEGRANSAVKNVLKSMGITVPEGAESFGAACWLRGYDVGRMEERGFWKRVEKWLETERGRMDPRFFRKGRKR